MEKGKGKTAEETGKAAANNGVDAERAGLLAAIADCLDGMTPEQLLWLKAVLEEAEERNGEREAQAAYHERQKGA